MEISTSRAFIDFPHVGRISHAWVSRLHTHALKNALCSKQVRVWALAVTPELRKSIKILFFFYESKLLEFYWESWKMKFQRECRREKYLKKSGPPQLDTWKLKFVKGKRKDRQKKEKKRKEKE